jgi:hypothetical protein
MKPQTAVKLSASAQHLIKNVRFSHKADIGSDAEHVRSWG